MSCRTVFVLFDLIYHMILTMTKSSVKSLLLAVVYHFVSSMHVFFISAWIFENLPWHTFQCRTTLKLWLTDSSVSRQKWDRAIYVTSPLSPTDLIYYTHTKRERHLPPRQSWGFIRGHCNLHHTLSERVPRAFFPSLCFLLTGAVLGQHLKL